MTERQGARSVTRGFVVALVGTVIVASSGCSFVFVTPPRTLANPENERCTDWEGWPTVDTVLAGYQVFRTLYAYSQSEESYRGQILSRGSDMGIGIAFASLATASAVYGAMNVAACKDLKEELSLDRDSQRRRRRLTAPRPVTVPRRQPRLEDVAENPSPAAEPPAAVGIPDAGASPVPAPPASQPTR